MSRSFGPRQFCFMTPKNGNTVLVTVNGPHLEFFDVPSGALASCIKTDLNPHENNSNKILDTYESMVACSSKSKGTILYFTLFYNHL